MCCKDCVRREIGCHASCGEYAKYRAMVDAARQKKINEFGVDYILHRGKLIRRTWVYGKNKIYM